MRQIYSKMTKKKLDWDKINREADLLTQKHYINESLDTIEEECSKVKHLISTKNSYIGSKKDCSDCLYKDNCGLREENKNIDSCERFKHKDREKNLIKVVREALKTNDASKEEIVNVCKQILKENV